MCTASNFVVAKISSIFRSYPAIPMPNADGRRIEQTVGEKFGPRRMDKWNEFNAFAKLFEQRLVLNPLPVFRESNQRDCVNARKLAQQVKGALIHQPRSADTEYRDR